MAIYETRVLAFVDILGWSEACQTESPLLAEASQVIHRVAAGSSRHRKDNLSTELPGIRVNPMFLEVEFGAFSDCFVLSKPASFGTRIFSVAQICRRLLKLGFLTRGGVTVGTVHHKDNVVFGPALIEAVALEKEAIFPRILCSNELLRHCEKVGPHGMNPIARDHLGRDIVNLFDPATTAEGVSVIDLCAEDWGLADIKKNIAIQIETLRASGSNKRMEKWQYMSDAMGAMLAKVPRS